MSKRPMAKGSDLQEVTPALVDLKSRLVRWRRKRKASPSWTFLVAAVLAVMSIPIVTIVILALSPQPGALSDMTQIRENIWPHLFANVLPIALFDTFFLIFGAGLLTLLVGTTAAWLVTMYRFPGREIVDRLLIIPLAMPTYIVAYCYVEIFDYAGPLQSMVRAITGASNAREYWFPDIRSLGGAVFVMSSVLYPYVYLTARATFMQQSICALEVARTLGRTPLGTLWSVALPLARPALAAGVALVVMECLNDIGAVKYLGVQTLTASVYDTWRERNHLQGAAQLAGVMLGLIALMLVLERLARGGAQIHQTTGRYRPIPFQDISGWSGYLACALCALPFVVGFLVPFLVLLPPAIAYGTDAMDGGFVKAAWNSIFLATIAMCVTVLIAVILSYARRVAGNGFVRPAVGLAGLGYALPGTILAIGLLYPLASFDNWVDEFGRSTFGISTGLLLSGSMFALCLAYVIRYLAVALGPTEAGLERISPNLDAASRALGETALSSLVRIHLPLIMPAVGAAGLLVFVDTMKELPATLLLRPFNFATLATEVYDFSSREQFEEAALGALSIVLVGLLPVLLLHRAVASSFNGRT